MTAADLQRMQAAMVIDASGPFQAYGDHTYKVVRSCLEARVNYLDFADGSDFVEGISAFDLQARQQGIFVLSGVSSFPVLTAAVVRLLTRDMLSEQAVTGAIAPSPFAVVGKNVIRAIAGYAGQTVKLVRDGQTHTAHALTEVCNYTIAPPGFVPLRHTRFSLVEVPDLHVLPKLWPSIQNIWMGAGPSPEVLHRMLKGLSWLVRWRLLPTLSPFSLLFFHAINLLRWGEHRGGMYVEVVGLSADRQALRRSWHLLAEGDDGPYIPCLALQAIVQKVLEHQPPRPGARPATNDLEIADYDALFATRTIYTGVRDHSPHLQNQSTFRLLLGASFDRLPRTLQAVHQGLPEQTLEGIAKVQRGKGLLANGVANLFGFPQTQPGVSICVKIQQKAGTEEWQRAFGKQRFKSTLAAGTGPSQWLLIERFGALRVHIALVVANSQLNWVVRGATLWGLRLPRMLLPSGNSYEYESEGSFHFHVEICLPLVGLVVRYEGWLKPVP